MNNDYRFNFIEITSQQSVGKIRVQLLVELFQKECVICN